MGNVDLAVTSSWPPREEQDKAGASDLLSAKHPLEDTSSLMMGTVGTGAFGLLGFGRRNLWFLGVIGPCLKA